MVAWEIVVFDAEDLRGCLSILAERKESEFALSDRAVLQGPAVEPEQRRPACRCIGADLDQLMFLLPPDRAQIPAGEFQPVEIDHARADEAVAEPQRLPLDIDDDQVRQQLAQLRRVEIRAQRQDVRRGQLDSPVLMEAMDERGIDLRNLEPVYLVDPCIDGAAAAYSSI
jgi:hypothetical protein